MSGGELHWQVDTFSRPPFAQMQERVVSLRLGVKDLQWWLVPTWVTEALVAGAQAAAGAVSAGAECAEVHQLGTGGAREASAAATAKAHPVSIAGPVVLAWQWGARVHLLFTGRAKVPCQETQTRRMGYIFFELHLHITTCKLSREFFSSLWID